jgi:glucose/arabinose dehydrogenase
VDGRLCALVSQRLASADFKTDAGTPSRTILQLACTTDVHAGGGIGFGPDGYLYIAMGDTGPQGDPQGHGQDLSLPLGKMLRIDVDHADDGKAYAIPADNPFRQTPGARPEIWAYGFREPWRFSFDPLNGDLWVGDVGQDRIEEVDLVRRGENYGWNVYEGFDPFSARRRRNGERYVPPVFAYARRLGNSVTGGYVYRGDKRSPYYGVYVCADYTSKRIWGLTQRDRAMESIRQIAACPQSVASFGTDEAGNLYVVGYEGTIYRMDFDGASFDQ